MSRFAKLSIIILRVVTGWFFLYQGIILILNSNWSLGPYIKNSILLPKFYEVVLQPSIVPYASYLAKGLFLIIGTLLMLGILVRISTLIGILLMFFFYLPLVRFPYVLGSFSLGNYYIVDDHIVLVAILLFLYAIRAGEYFGLGSMFKFSRY